MESDEPNILGRDKSRIWRETMKVKLRINRSNQNSHSLTKHDHVCRKIIEYGILGLIIFSPLPAASVYDWSILVIQLSVIVMMVAYLLMREKPHHNELLFQSLKWPRYLFSGFFIFLFIQIMPFPNFFLKIFSPNIYSSQQLFSADFSKVKFMSFSLLPSYTLREGLEILSYFLLGFLIIKTVTKRRQIMRIFYVLITLGVFEALYGFIELYTKNPRILFYQKIHYLDEVTGTFINRNHFSGYLEMIIPLTIGLILARIDLFSMAGLKWNEKILQFSEKGFAINFVLSFCVIFMSMAILFSKSRSGVFLLIFIFILFFGMSVLFSEKVKYPQIWVRRFLQLTISIIVFVSLYVGIGTTIERFAVDEILNEGRPAVWANVSGIVSDFPVFGSGLGTFATLYPAYEEIWKAGRYSHAHNDYLEYLSELGAVGFALLLGGILFMLGRSYLMWRERRHPEVKGLTLGGIIAVISLLIHSIGDFNLHIPANMLLFTVVLSLTVVMAFHKKQNSKQEKQTARYEQVRNEESAGRKAVNKTFVFIACLVCIGIMEILIYGSRNLYNKAETIEDDVRKVKVLKWADRLYPSNDFVSYRLGETYFNLGIQNLVGDKKLSDVYLEKSFQKFNQSLRANPISSFSHFYYAQILLYMSYLSTDNPQSNRDLQIRACEEYKKAALLAGHNHQILLEVGKVLFSQWPKLSDEDKKFITDILKRIAGDLNATELRAIMNIWEMNVKDYSIIEKILPAKENIYRLYAQFLGEKSLSSERKQLALEQAEFLDFERAKLINKAGHRAFVSLNFEDALQQYEASLKILGSVKFYQDLTGHKLIGQMEFDSIKKSVCLRLAKCYLELGIEPDKRDKYLRLYIELENSVADIYELEDYLIKDGFIREDMGSEMDNLGRLTLKYLLHFKQNRYREIIRAGDLLKESFIVVPESSKEAYVEVLQIVGDSHQKAGYIYDAAEFYQMALEVDPDNLKTFVNIRRNKERLSEDEGVQRIQKELEKIMSPREIVLENSPISKGKPYKQKLILDGQKINLSLHFKGNKKNPSPLISVFFNGEIIWENYLAEDILTIPLNSKVGRNTLRIVSINRVIDLQKICYI